MRRTEIHNRNRQARGEHNPRDLDKYVFRIPFPTFEPASERTPALVGAAAHAEAVSAGAPPFG